MTDIAEVYTLATLSREWSQARLTLIINGDLISAILLFFSWTWLVGKGMFWSCSPYPDSESLEGNCLSAGTPSEHLMRLSWALPFAMA